MQLYLLETFFKSMIENTTYSLFILIFLCFSRNWKSRCKNDEKLLQKAVSQWGTCMHFSSWRENSIFHNFLLDIQNQAWLSVSTTEIPLSTIHPFIPFLVRTESWGAKMTKKKICFKRPFLNGGTCMHFSGRCACLPGFKGRRCQRTQAKRE